MKNDIILIFTQVLLVVLSAIAGNFYNKDKYKFCIICILVMLGFTTSILSYKSQQKTSDDIEIAAINIKSIKNSSEVLSNKTGELKNNIDEVYEKIIGLLTGIDSFAKKQEEMNKSSEKLYRNFELLTKDIKSIEDRVVKINNEVNYSTGHTLELKNTIKSINDSSNLISYKIDDANKYISKIDLIHKAVNDSISISSNDKLEIINKIDEFRRYLQSKGTETSKTSSTSPSPPINPPAPGGMVIRMK